MAQQKPTAFLFLDKRRIKKNGKYPVKLIVDFKEEKKSFSVPFDFTETDWKKIFSPRLKDEKLKEAKEKLSILTGSKFNTTLRKMEDAGIPFSFEIFGELYFNKATGQRGKTDVYSVFESKIKELISQDRIGTAQSYQTALNAFKTFRKRLQFTAVTPRFLRDLEKYLLNEKKLSVTSVGIYMRAMRVIINRAIHNPVNPINIEYPFSQHSSDGKYKVPIGNNLKKALSFDDIEKLKAYKANTDSEQRALDFWLFSYYCNGINMSDICRLKFANIIHSQIVFTRSKTTETRNKSKAIQAFFHPEMKRIIDKWGNAKQNDDNYIFPILEKNISAQREHQLIKQNDYPY